MITGSAVETEDITDIIVTCATCDHDLVKMFNVSIPLVADFHMICPTCKRLLNKKHHFQIYMMTDDLK